MTGSNPFSNLHKLLVIVPSGNIGQSTTTYYDDFVANHITCYNDNPQDIKNDPYYNRIVLKNHRI